MGQAIREVAETIASAAGWRVPPASGDGSYRFLLEDGLELRLSSPDGRRVVLWTDLGPAPDAETPDGSERWKAVGRMSAARAAHFRSHAAARAGRLELERRLAPESGAAEWIEAARTFLNEAADWREALTGAVSAEPAASSSALSSLSPFSFGGNWFPEGIRI